MGGNVKGEEEKRKGRSQLKGREVGSDTEKTDRPPATMKTDGVALFFVS